jgi:hypothetical protein
MNRDSTQPIHLDGHSSSMFTLLAPLNKPKIRFFTPPFDVSDQFKNRIVSHIVTNQDIVEFPLSPSFDWDYGDETHLFALGALHEDKKDPSQWDILCVDHGHITFLKDWKNKGIQPPGGCLDGQDIVFDPRVIWP